MFLEPFLKILTSVIHLVDFGSQAKKLHNNLEKIN